ncbi:MAG: peptidylprolyl isomerase [Acidobacteria bacterium]|nr:peptidylprolyl isomerase [Acidobacteriota bacterium]
MQGKRINLIVFALVLGVATSGSMALRAQDETQAPAASKPADSGSADAQTPVGPDEVVMTIGDTKITRKDFDAITQALPPEAATAFTTMGKKGFAERYANLVSLAKEGEKQKIDESPVFERMAAFQRMMLLAQLTVSQILVNMGPLSGDEVSYYYTTHQLDFQQVKLRGIYIPFSNDAAKPGSRADAKSKQPTPKSAKQLTEAEAKAKADALRNRVKAGESMATLAKKESDHPTAANGGDFGFVRRGQFAQQIDSVIFNLEPKQISLPVKDRFGFFIFQVDEKRVQSLEDAKAIIENGLRQQRVGEMLNKVQSQQEVTYNPRFFDEPEATLPGALPAAPTAPGNPGK